MDRSALRGGGCALLYGVRGNRLGNLADRRSHLCTTGMIAEERVTTRAVAFRTHTVTGQDIGSHGEKMKMGWSEDVRPWKWGQSQPTFLCLRPVGTRKNIAKALPTRERPRHQI